MIQIYFHLLINFINNKYIITVKEFPNINKINFNYNDRLKDEDLEYIALEIKLINSNIIY